MTAEDTFFDEEEEEAHTSEYHSPPEERTESEEEEEEEGWGRERVRDTRDRRRERGKAREEREGRGRKEKSSPRTKNPSKLVDAVTHTTAAAAAVTGGDQQAKETQRSGSERHCSYGGGMLSPVLESPEYRGSAVVSGNELEKELESDLEKALLRLNSETSGLRADSKEVELIEQTAARKSDAGSTSESPSPFPSSSAPHTPNTVVWERGKCVPLTPQPEAVKGDEKRRKENEGEGERGEKEDQRKEGVREAEGESVDFAAIPKVKPSLGLKEGHDRQQLGVARSSNRRRPPTKHASTPPKVTYSVGVFCVVAVYTTS